MADTTTKEGRRRRIDELESIKINSLIKSYNKTGSIATLLKINAITGNVDMNGLTSR